MATKSETGAGARFENLTPWRVALTLAAVLVLAGFAVLP